MNLDIKMQQAHSINEVYDLLSEYLQSILESSICILIQLDEKRDEAFVYDIIGLSQSLLVKSIKTFGLNPIGKRFKNTKHGRENFYHTNHLESFKGSLFEFSEGVFPQWVCKTIENIFRLDNIYTIGLNHENVLIGSVFIFPRGLDKIKFSELEQTVPLFSRRMKEILDLYNYNITGGTVKEKFTTSIINNLSHEIRTPLNGIVGLMDAGLRMLNSNPDTQELSSAIWENSNELTNKLDNLLLLADFESNSVILKKKSYSLEQVYSCLQGVANQLESLFKYRSIELKLDDDCKHNSTTIELDIEIFKIAIIELIKNALKYSSSEVIIKMKFHHALLIEVVDFGVGMSNHEMRSYYDFDINHKLLLHKSNGLGIGVSLVKLISRKHDWKLRIDSELGRGTSVQIVFDHIIKPSFN
ncbi:sensor histidine kinase [Labilibacter marinus]|uniref:sensor histidine kinase n=1 Tax=Labilibacter marinus TaxID=1477105 RepID=UPI00094F5BB7|nr:ATP-binding protein [Labilibacter marinus]